MKKLALQTAQASWVYGENESKWCVKTPQGDVLFILDGEFDERSAMQAIHLGRTFEIAAYNEGVKVATAPLKTEYESKIKKLEHAVKTLGKMNEDLSAQLERHIDRE